MAPQGETSPMNSPMKRTLRSALLLSWALGLLALVSALGVGVVSSIVCWDVSLREQQGQLSVFNSLPEGGYFGMPVEMADFDGDGKVDLVLAPMAAPGGPTGERDKAGNVYLYPGSREIGGIIDRKAMGDRPAGLTLWGARADDFLGTELFAADVNGDGFIDLIVGSQNYDGPDGLRDNCGGAFVVLGRPGLLGSSPADGNTFDLADPPEGVITIVGAHPGDRLGIWVEAGDLDGDGMADILVGADQAGGASGDKLHAGQVAVIYGRKDFPPVLDLSQVGSGAEPVTGVSFIHGRDAEDHLGSRLHARDLNRDGSLELIVSAALNRLSASYGGTTTGFEAHGEGGGSGPDNLRPDCGEVYVIFGDASAKRLPPSLDLAALPQEFQTRITVIYGEKEWETAGEELASGDFNGDGFPDLAIGALAATNPLGQPQAGAVHVIYWQPGLEGKVIDFRFPERFPSGLQVADILGQNAQDILGDTMAVGDFNHDGIDDLAVGIPHVTVHGQLETGEVAVLYGRPEPFPRRIYPQQRDPAVRIAFVLGAQSSDLLSYSMQARDYDGDGYTDLFPNAMRGDGAADNALDAGEAYLVSGFYLSGGQVVVEGVDPPFGRVGLEVPVVVRGNGFTRDEDTKVLLGGETASQVHVLSGSRISCVFPVRGSPAALPVAVQNRHGGGSLEEGFRYLEAFTFIRGDSDGDGGLTINDPVLTLNFLFLGSTVSCLERHDATDDGQLDISDPVRTLGWLFTGGPPPAPPFPEPGFDPTPDSLGCR
jgi:hypothetical protein